MMRHPLMLLAGVIVLTTSACAFHNSVERIDGAPILPPSAEAEAVAEAPPGAVALGRVVVQGNNYQNGAGCEAQALFEAKKIGATHVVIRPADSSLGRGVKCTGDAFYLKPPPR
jgi:hypothetical protein